MKGYCLYCGLRLHWLRHPDSLYCDRQCGSRQQRAIAKLESTTPDGRAVVNEASRGMRRMQRETRAAFGAEAAS